jgi:hypothetical protein
MTSIAQLCSILQTLFTVDATRRGMSHPGFFSGLSSSAKEPELERFAHREQKEFQG